MSAPATVIAPRTAPLSREPMSWFGIGAKVGLGGSRNIAVNEWAVQRSPELRVSVPVNMGGGGFGWLIEPGFSVGKAKREDVGSLWELDPAPFIAGALYTGPTINMHLSDALYFALGFGVRVSHGSVRVGHHPHSVKFTQTELTSRIPLSATYYMGEDIALVAEVALGGGGAWTKAPDEESWDDADNFVFVYDVAVGMRWP